jgi:hypothetical protein
MIIGKEGMIFKSDIDKIPSPSKLCHQYLSMINFIHCVEDLEVTSGWLFTSVCSLGLWCLTPFSTIFPEYP